MILSADHGRRYKNCCRTHQKADESFHVGPPMVEFETATRASRFHRKSHGVWTRRLRRHPQLGGQNPCGQEKSEGLDHFLEERLRRQRGPTNRGRVSDISDILFLKGPRDVAESRSLASLGMTILRSAQTQLRALILRRVQTPALTQVDMGVNETPLVAPGF